MHNYIYISRWGYEVLDVVERMSGNISRATAYLWAAELDGRCTYGEVKLALFYLERELKGWNAAGNKAPSWHCQQLAPTLASGKNWRDAIDKNHPVYDLFNYAFTSSRTSVDLIVARKKVNGILNEHQMRYAPDEAVEV